MRREKEWKGPWRHTSSLATIYAIMVPDAIRPRSPNFQKLKPFTAFFSREEFFPHGFSHLSRKDLPTCTGSELHFVCSLVESSTTGWHVFFPVSENHMHFSENIKSSNEMEDFQLQRCLSLQVETSSFLLLWGDWGKMSFLPVSLSWTQIIFHYPEWEKKHKYVSVFHYFGF